jgi:hypothetical protein
MFKNKKLSLIILSALVITTALGLMAFAPFDEGAVVGAVDSHGRKPGNKNDDARHRDGAYLAEALGISEDELQAAVEEAQAAALDQALAEGLITQEQADAMAGRGFRLPRGIGGPDSGIDFNAFLADALGISVGDFDLAREAAHEAAIQQALEDGVITEEQVALKEAREAFWNAMPKDEIQAKALGISLDELEAAKNEGIRVPDLLEELGIDPEDFAANMEAAWEEAIQDAVSNGTLTQEQADLLLADGFHGMRHPGGRGHHGRSGTPNFGGERPEGGPGGNRFPSQGDDDA